MSESGSQRRDEMVAMISSLDDSRRVIGERIIDEMLFMEEKMDECRECPFLQRNEKGEVKSTQAATLYRNLVAQYNNAISSLIRLTGHGDEGKDTSPLREYFESMKKRS